MQTLNNTIIFQVINNWSNFKKTLKSSEVYVKLTLLIQQLFKDLDKQLATLHSLLKFTTYYITSVWTNIFDHIEILKFSPEFVDKVPTHKFILCVTLFGQQLNQLSKIACYYVLISFWIKNSHPEFNLLRHTYGPVL